MLHTAVASRSFRRYSTYVGATLAGIYTDSVFGAIMCFVHLEVWAANPDAGGTAPPTPDEPTSRLDVISKGRLREFLRARDHLDAHDPRPAGHPGAATG